MQKMVVLMQLTVAYSVCFNCLTLNESYLYDPQDVTGIHLHDVLIAGNQPNCHVARADMRFSSLEMFFSKPPLCHCLAHLQSNMLCFY